jgi:hypothetical protein
MTMTAIKLASDIVNDYAESYVERLFDSITKFNGITASSDLTYQEKQMYVFDNLVTALESTLPLKEKPPMKWKSLDELFEMVQSGLIRSFEIRNSSFIVIHDYENERIPINIDITKIPDSSDRIRRPYMKEVVNA